MRQSTAFLTVGPRSGTKDAEFPSAALSRVKAHVTYEESSRRGYAGTILVAGAALLLAISASDQSRGEIMAQTEWGLCKDCKWWQIEPAATAANTTMGLCIDENLQEFQLRVSGNSGCNRFMPGKPAHAKGSGAAPPAAAPTR